MRKAAAENFAKRAGRGFTLLELAVVVAVIGILLGIVSTAAAGSIREARSQKAAALCKLVQTGLATYYAQFDEWPGPLNTKVESGNFAASNDEGVDGRTDANKYVLTSSEVRAMVKALVDETKKGNPLIDVSGLFVSRNSGEPGSKGFGLDFIDAIHGTRKSSRKMSTGEMYYGYPETSHGYFRRFKMVYSIPSDSLEVMTQ